jgi:hypothetical protein
LCLSSVKKKPKLSDNREFQEAAQAKKEKKNQGKNTEDFRLV